MEFINPRLCVIIILVFLVIIILIQSLKYRNNILREIGENLWYIFITMIIFMGGYIIFNWLNANIKLTYLTIEEIIFFAALFAGFLSTVLSEKQNQKLKNGGYATIITAGLSSFVSLSQEGNNENIVLFSLFGSTTGALLGWIFFFIIAIYSSVKYQGPLPFIELITQGLEGLRDQIIQKESERNCKELDNWLNKFYNNLSYQTNNVKDVVRNREQGNEYSISNKLVNELIKETIRTSLVSFCEVLNFVKGYTNARASLILFGSKENKIIGKHWISYRSGGKRFKIDEAFDDTSKAYKVVKDKTPWPCFVDTKKKGDDIQQRSDANSRYDIFTLFKITNEIVLTIDWSHAPKFRGIFATRDVLVKKAEEFFQDQIVPAFKELLSLWINGEQNVNIKQKDFDSNFLPLNS